MTVQEIKNLLWQLAQPRPMLAGLMMKRMGDLTVGERWGMLLKDCDAHHLEDVIEEWQTKQMPERLDDLPYMILQEVEARSWKEQERLHQQEMYHSRKKMPWRDGDNRDRTCVAIRHVLQQKVGIHDLNQLAAWGRYDKGDQVPECLESESQLAAALSESEGE